MEGSIKCSANYVPLSPISFLDRAAVVYRDRISVVYGDIKYTWHQTRDRCVKLASALSDLKVDRGDVVAVLSPNVPAMYELHFAVPMAGAVLCTLNIRHDAAMVAILLKHSEAKLIFVDYEFYPIIQGALQILRKTNTELPIIVLIQEYGQDISRSEHLDYESLLETGVSDFVIRRPVDECDAITINYTSGTTSDPKGVIYSHRGAYLNSMALVLLSGMNSLPVYLWTFPMFHCNGLCLTWGVAAQGGTNICLRNVTSKGIFDNIALHKVTHMGGAPTVLNMIINAPVSDLTRKVVVLTGAAPPAPYILYKMDEIGFSVVHIYGLTETYGPGTVCSWKPEWDLLPRDEQAKLRSRQGLNHIAMEEVDVVDPDTMISVMADGKTKGEVVFKGNTVMNGYLKNVKATEAAFKGGWFWTGDVAVKHSDGYIEIKDRSKDIIISGGENISSIEVESVLIGHPCVFDAAVVGRPDEHWGETVCAFVMLKDGVSVTAEELIQFCRDNLPHYMAPRSIVFGELPKTSTGKTQKFALRAKAKGMSNIFKKSISKL